MIFKMRILFFSKTGNTELMAQAISREQKASSDKIPPAYPCESEKLLFIGVETGKKADKAVVDFCNGLTPQRAKNVAFFAVGPSFEAVDELKSIITKNGLTVVGNTHQCTVKSGLFSKGKVSDADITAVVKWSSEIIKKLS